MCFFKSFEEDLNPIHKHSSVFSFPSLVSGMRPLTYSLPISLGFKLEVSRILPSFWLGLQIVLFFTWWSSQARTRGEFSLRAHGAGEMSWSPPIFVWTWSPYIQIILQQKWRTWTAIHPYFPFIYFSISWAICSKGCYSFSSKAFALSRYLSL